jgi:hypothetical protein
MEVLQAQIYESASDPPNETHDINQEVTRQWYCTAGLSKLIKAGNKLVPSN